MVKSQKNIFKKKKGGGGNKYEEMRNQCSQSEEIRNLPISSFKSPPNTEMAVTLCHNTNKRAYEYHSKTYTS